MPTVLRYAGAVLLVALATVLTRLLSSIGDAGISPLFFAAVLISAWFGGLGPGLLATGLSGLATAYLLIPRADTLVGVRDATIRVIVFTIVAILASSLHEATKRASEAFRRARDLAEETSAAKTRFLAMVSHELRTPLSTVTLLADALADDPALSDRVRKDAARILQAARLEVRLIDDLVDLSSITSGKLRLAQADIDLHQPLLAAIQSCEESIGQKQIKLTVDLVATHTSVVADSVRLQQVFWNLLRNAVKFTPDGGSIHVRSWDDAAHVCVQVSDNGIGIDPQRLSWIFRAFEQGDADIPARFGGLGLGLSICQALVEAHRGQITAASEGRGRGASFTVSFPTVCPQAFPTLESNFVQTSERAP
jgi:signal transduction histidine kinase